MIRYFPLIVIRGIVSTDRITNANTAKSAIKKGLEIGGINAVTETEGTLNFERQRSFIGRGNIFSPIDRGTFQFSEGNGELRVKFVLSIVKMYLSSLILALLTIVIVFSAARSNSNVSAVSLASRLSIGIFVLTAVNYVIIRVRFPLWIRRILNSAS